MKTLLLALISCGFSLTASAQTRPHHSQVSLPSVATTPMLACRDFDTMKQTQLPLCDFVMTDQLKTNLLALLITEQKTLDSLLANTALSPEKTNFYHMVKDYLSSIERYSVQKIADICYLKGRLILQTPGLISGCIYNQFAKMKFTIGVLQKDIVVTTVHNASIPSEEQKKFDVFVNDLLLDLAEKNRNYYPNNAAIKTLMAEVLKIYGGDGKSLYASFLGICGLQSITQVSPINEPDTVSECEAAYLKDLRQTLFLAI